MKRLCHKRYFHLTNDKSFNFSCDFNNNQQEFGKGLYITPENNIANWDHNLGGRNYAIEVFADGLNIISEDKFPSEGIMAKEILKNGYKVEDVEQELPTGNTFGREPMNIATKRFYAKMLNYDGIKPYIDSIEGEQIVLICSDINFGQIYNIEDFV